MRHTLDYITLVDNVIPEYMCNEMIDKWEAHTDIIQRDTEYYSFGELNISHCPEFENETKFLFDSNKKLYTLYRERIGGSFMPPIENITFEEFRMKKYEPDGKDIFDWHTDVGDYASAKRFLVILYYLNDVEKGGETYFESTSDDRNAVKVKAQQGHVAMFPPTWQYPHKGSKPISGPKYIISSYAHYI